MNFEVNIDRKYLLNLGMNKLRNGSVPFRKLGMSVNDAHFDINGYSRGEEKLISTTLGGYSRKYGI